jgi:hypothetical protein
MIAILHKPSGILCELERDKTGALVCFMVFKTMAAALACMADRVYFPDGAEDFEAVTLPAGVRAPFLFGEVA